MTFIIKIEKSTLKLIWRHRRPQTAKALLSKKNNAGGIMIPNFKLYYKVITIKIAWYWHKNRHEDQWNRIEDPDMNPHNYVHLILTMVLKIYNGEKTASSTNVAGKSGYPPAKKLKLDPCLLPCTSMNSKWIKDLNIRLETLKLIQKGAGNTLEVTGIGKDFLNGTSAAQQLRESIDKWDFIKLKSFCTTTEMVSKLKRPPTEWEKIFASYTSDKGLITRIYRKLKKLNSTKINEPRKKWATELNRFLCLDFSKEEIQMAKKHMKSAHHL
jgi:hypothetical protein